MKYAKTIYTDDGIKHLARIKRKLNTGAGLINIFVITICEGTDQLEIYPSYVLMQAYYHHHPPFIIGIASSYEHAIELVRQIVQECILQNGNCDLKQYLLDKEKIHAC